MIFFVLGLFIGLFLGMILGLKLAPNTEEIGKYILDDLLVPKGVIISDPLIDSSKGLVEKSGPDYLIKLGDEVKYSGRDSDEAYVAWLEVQDNNQASYLRDGIPIHRGFLNNDN